MSWYFFAFLSPLLWAMSNHIDKYILSKYFKNINNGILAIFAGLVGFLFSICIAVFAPHSIVGISIFHAIIIILNGALLIIAFIPYYYALSGEDASSVVPLYQTIPVFSFIIGYFLLGESISLTQIIAGLLIIVGSILITINLDNLSKIIFKKRVLLLMLLSSLLISVHFLVFKLVALEESFARTVFWEYLGAALVAVFLLVFIKKYRVQFRNAIRENSLSIISINILNESINIVAKLLANFATLTVPVVIVNLANGLQPLFVLVIGVLLTLFLPFINTEAISTKLIFQRIIAIIILLTGTYLLV